MTSMENLPPVVMRAVAREIHKLVKKPPSGVRFIPREDDTFTTVLAELDGPAETPFVGGKFLVKLVVDSSFPASPPKGYFLTKIFHPNVSPAGEICVNALKKDWRPNMGFAHVLKVIWCLLLVPFPESALNDEAGRLFRESYEDYCKKAAMMTQVYAMRTTGRGGVRRGPTSSSSSSDTSSSSSSSSLGSTKTLSDSSMPKSLKSKSPNRIPTTTGATKKRRSPSSDDSPRCKAVKNSYMPMTPEPDNCGKSIGLAKKLRKIGAENTKVPVQRKLNTSGVMKELSKKARSSKKGNRRKSRLQRL